MSQVIETTLRPRLIEYADYHQYLRDFYAFKKAQTRAFSFRKFAQLAGIKSSNYLHLVMERRRNLSVDMATAIARAMKLSKNESDFFVALVKSERARTPEEQELVAREKKIAIKKIISKTLPAEKSEYLSVWYYSLVRELAFLPDFSPSASWISARLGGLISVEQAEGAIRILVNLGLWRKVDGKIQVSDLFVDTGSEEQVFGEVNLATFHKENLLAWTKILEDLPKAKREFGILNIPIHDSKLPELKARIQRFQDEIVGWLQDESLPNELVQLGVYLVPVTKEI